MIKRISIFSLVRGGPLEWPAPIQDRFGKQMSRDVLSFDAGSELEAEFEESLEGQGLKICRSQVLKVTGKDVYEFPFHYLSVREDKYYDKGNFRDPGCPGGDGLRCGVGAQQTQKVTVDSSRSKQLDIMMDAGWPRPFVYLVSRRLRQLLAEQAFSGFRLVPCLRSTADYSEEERSFDYTSARLEEEATHFQLVVSGKTLGVPEVGEVVRVFSECPRCHFIGGIHDFPRFRPGDLSDDDFQLVWTYSSTNLGRFDIRGELLIVSRRVLCLLRENKVSGLGPFMTDPRISHGVVDILDREAGPS